VNGACASKRVTVAALESLATAVALTAAACAGATAQPAASAPSVPSAVAPATASVTLPVFTPTPALLPSNRLVPSNPCLWLLQSDAQNILGTLVYSGSTALGPQDCIYYASFTPSATLVAVDIVDSTAFAQTEADPGYTITPVPGIGDLAFFAILNVSAGANPPALYVRVDTDVFFSVEVAYPNSRQTQVEAQERTAAFDVLSNLNLP